MRTLTRKEILDEILGKIKEQGGRCSVEGLCRLQISNRRCAFSHALRDEVRNRYLGSGISGLVADVWGSGAGEEQLLEKYRGHGCEFWVEVQNLHDNNQKMNHDGTLTVFGVEVYHKLSNETN